MVLQPLSHPGQRTAHRHARRLERRRLANARELQELWRAERARGEHHLTARAQPDCGAAVVAAEMTASHVAAAVPPRERPHLAQGRAQRLACRLVKVGTAPRLLLGRRLPNTREAGSRSVALGSRSGCAPVAFLPVALRLR